MLVDLDEIAEKVRFTKKMLEHRITKRNKKRGVLEVCGERIPLFKDGVKWYAKEVDLKCFEQPTVVLPDRRRGRRPSTKRT